MPCLVAHPLCIQDERILEALYSKHEREVEDEVRKSAAQSAWEEEKLKLERERDLAEHRRRTLLAERIGNSVSNLLY